MSVSLLTRGMLAPPGIPEGAVLDSLLPNPEIVYLPNSGTGWVLFDRAVDTTKTVTLSSDDTDVVTVPASVQVPVGETGASFPITAVSQGTTTIRASFGGDEVTAQVEIRPTIPYEVVTRLSVDLEDPALEVVLGDDELDIDVEVCD